MRVRCHTNHAIEFARHSSRTASCSGARPSTTRWTTSRIRPNASVSSSALVISGTLPPTVTEPTDRLPTRPPPHRLATIPCARLVVDRMITGDDRQCMAGSGGLPVVPAVVARSGGSWRDARRGPPGLRVVLGPGPRAGGVAGGGPAEPGKRVDVRDGGAASTSVVRGTGGAGREERS